MAYGFYQGFGMRGDAAPYYAAEMSDGDKSFVGHMQGNVYTNFAVDLSEGEGWNRFKRLASDPAALAAECARVTG